MGADHPSLLLNARLFSGIEQEGPYKGLKTLFVADPTLTWGDLEPHIQDHEQVYFGAARLSKVNWSAVEQALEFTKLLVTVETAKLTAQRTLAIFLGHPATRDDWCRLHLVLTAFMCLPTGQLVAEPLDLEKAFMAYRQFPNNISIKLDWGTRVLVISRENTYLNDFTGDYSSDKKIL